MAETLISPGVLASENDQSQITSQPIQAGAALVGPTVKGEVNIPKLITTYSEYQANFGTTFDSGSDEYTFLTSISAYNYFQNGGNSLIVTRVASGTFTTATSSLVGNNTETGDIIATTDLSNNTFTGAAGISVGPNVGAIENGGTTSGTGLTLDVVATLDNGKLVVGDNITINNNPINLTADDTYTVNAVTGGATFQVVVLGGTIDPGTAQVINPGTGYEVNDIITLDISAIPGAGNQICNLTLLASSNILPEITSIIVNNPGSGYVLTEGQTDTLVIPSSELTGASTDLVITLTADNILDGNAFTLETIGQGAIMNSSGAENSQGALTNGTKDNLRWEIQNPNTTAGTFNLIIRRGNDQSNRKSVVEQFTNLSLDPKAPNYIARIIGNQKAVVAGSGTDTYLQTSGAYPNASRFVRVKSVNFKTPNYLDNSGNPKAEYINSIPVAASGTFEGAVGNTVSGTGKYYEQISSVDTQGLVDTDYTTAFNLLANKDEFKYNLITAPGLFHAGHSSVLNTLISTAESRADNIVVVDLEAYASTPTAAVQTATALDTSYAAAYWPWCQVTDPDTGQLVWVPASTLIPGVYAKNDKTAEAWFAPAGINRGGLSTVVQAERKLTQANRDALYTGKVNPIATFPGRGVVVFGQKTLQRQASALDRVNVRRLLIALKNYISQVSDNLVFEQNTSATRNVFLSQVNPYLESVQQRQGLYAFKVVMDSSNNGADVIDKNELKGAIYIQPTKTAEFIYLDFNILPTGAEFPS